MSELIRFNIQNAKYAAKTSTGWGSFVSFGTSKKIALSPDMSSKKIYGDGVEQAEIVNERGKEVVLTLNTLCEAFELATGRKMNIANGVAEIDQKSTPEFVVYFETCAQDGDGSRAIAKTMLYGITSTTRPTENYDQNTEELNESEFELAMRSKGIILKDSQGADYKDAKGNTIRIFKLTKVPTDTGYSTFGESVVIPTSADIPTVSGGDGN